MFYAKPCNFYQKYWGRLLKTWGPTGFDEQLDDMILNNQVICLIRKEEKFTRFALRSLFSELQADIQQMHLLYV